jgi:hypothetical protein
MELEFFHDEALARLVHDLTMGHPGMVQRVIKWLQEKKIRIRKDLDRIALAELGQFVDGLLDAYILKDVDADLKPVIRQLAYYRQFAWNEVSRILHLSVPECGTFIRERLLPTGLVEWDQNRYVIDKTARELFLNIAFFQDTARFIATHTEIGNHSEVRAAKLTENWHFFVVEHLYHLVNELRGRRQASEVVDVAATLLSRLNEHLQRMTDLEGLYQLRETLKHDGELEFLVEQAHPGLQDTLLKTIDERIDALGGTKK